MAVSSWDVWVEEALSKLESLKLLRSLRPISLLHDSPEPSIVAKVKTFEGLQSWDRSSVEVHISESTFQNWVHNIASSGDENVCRDGGVDGKVGARRPKLRKLLLFSGNDYLGLSSHPSVCRAAAQAAQEHGMGPRGSALICGYTDYHRLLESCLADLKKKEDCLLCPTGFAANMAVMVTLGSVSSLLAAGKKPLKDEKVAIFSDALNHASIIDGIRLAERQQEVEIFVYKHCDTVHLNSLLSSCTVMKKVVVTDSLFSMDGDFAPLPELAELRKKHGFLLVIDDAHGTLVCGMNGGGVAEQYNRESDIDICVGTLSKAAGCHGGFVACRTPFPLSQGNSFVLIAVDYESKSKWSQAVACPSQYEDGAQSALGFFLDGAGLFVKVQPSCSRPLLLNTLFQRNPCILFFDVHQCRLSDGEKIDGSDELGDENWEDHGIVLWSSCLGYRLDD
ncbi:hypothetical protein GIB67_008598 [Kingdonia uniflora]|uniref:Aminotransferase class I/classII large domain-containing protein n=1 Tax=Kingdonia uniflora TaxID=39325 RepID=A0A7J7M4S8_9MAGN|nr:hypothetical protein GIB67_008598 [Kingdonia uniflora]